MKKKLWTLALAFCLVSAMLPGGVFHAERAWAAEPSSQKASTVSIAGKKLDGTTPYYYNGENGGVGTVTNTEDASKGEPNATFEDSTGTVTLNGLELTGTSANALIAADTGNLTIELKGENHITQMGSRNAVYVVNDNLTISGAGKLTVKDGNTNSNASLIYAGGTIEILNGAVIDAANTARTAQTINAHGSITISGKNTSVKAVNSRSGRDTDAIRVDSAEGNGVGKGTLTVTNGATLEAETKSKKAKAINGDVKISDNDNVQVMEGADSSSAKVLDKSAELNTYQYVKITSETATTPPTPSTPTTENYLTFTAEVDNSSVTLNYASGSEVQYKQYTKTSNKWVEWKRYDKGTKITLASGDKVSFKGKDVKTWADSNKTLQHFTMSGRIAASGSVTSLTDGLGNDPNVTLQEMCYAYMFEGCTALTTAPELPAMEIPKSAYKEMFRGCTALTEAPKLPATNLKDWCYSYMFYNCTSLKTAPTLPATELAEDCYNAMFGECTSLTAAPQLPAMMKIPASAYAYMFYKCTSLTAAPELPATEIAASSYYDMFAGCTSLTTPPPTLPAESLKYWCYKAMFSGCTSLKTVPTISATSLATECCSEMFSGCTNLSISSTSDTQHTKEWRINATASENPTNWNYNMFEDCQNVNFGNESNTPALNTPYYVNPNGANSGGTTPTGTKITTPRLAQNTFPYKGTNITPTLQFTNPNDKEHVTISGGTSKKDVGNYTIRVTPKPGYTWADNSSETVSFSWNITRAGNIYVNVENLTAYVDDTTLPQHKYTITGLLGEDQNQASVIFAYHRIIDAAGNAEQKESEPDLTKEGKYRIDVSGLTIAEAGYTQNYTDLNYTSGKLEIVKKDSTSSGSSGGGYVAPSTDVKTSGSADSKVTSSPSTVQNETRTDASGKQETVAKVTVSAANQREILSQAKANKSKRIIIQIAKTAVQGDAKLELNLDKTFVQSILHDTEASLTIRTADGDRVISREALKTLVAQTEGNTVTIDPAAQEKPTDPAEPSKAETLAAIDSSRLVARSKLVTLKNGKKGIRITWSDRNGAEMNFDGVEIYRSTKKNRFGKKPFYATKGSKSAGYYINSKSLKSGVTYYYKVRGYVLIDGQKHYTDLSLKAIRTVK